MVEITRDIVTGFECARRTEQAAEQRAACKEELLDAQMKSLTAKPQEWKAAAQAYLTQKALDAFRAQEREGFNATASEQPKSWWEKAKGWVQQHIVQPVQQAVPKVMNWVDQHQTQIAIGVGIAAGVAAIVLSGGAATPLVAAAWVAGSAAVAGGIVAGGTAVLNAYFHRPLTTNLWRSVGYAAGAAAVTATAGFALQAVAPTVTRAAAQFCLSHVTTCTVASPVLKAADYGWTGYDVWQSQRTLANPRAGADEKLLAAVNIGLAAWSESLEPDDALAIGLPLDDVARKQLLKQFAEILEREGKDAAFDYLRKVLGDVPLTRLRLLDEDVIEYAAQQGPDAVRALTSGWKDEELLEHGVELALRAERDGKALKATEELAKLGDINDPKARQLIQEIAENSVQGSGERFVIGAWDNERGIAGGYVAEWRANGGLVYTSHPEIYTILEKAFGKDSPQLKQALWEINKAALEKHIAEGMMFDYSLQGIRDIERELKAIEAVRIGDWNAVRSLLGSDKARMHEVKLLFDAGYDYSVDLAKKVLHWSKP